jgi:hypothetical protein
VVVDGPRDGVDDGPVRLGRRRDPHRGEAFRRDPAAIG